MATQVTTTYTTTTTSRKRSATDAELPMPLPTTRPRIFRSPPPTVMTTGNLYNTFFLVKGYPLFGEDLFRERTLKISDGKWHTIAMKFLYELCSRCIVTVVQRVLVLVLLRLDLEAIMDTGVCHYTVVAPNTPRGATYACVLSQFHNRCVYDNLRVIQHDNTLRINTCDLKMAQLFSNFYKGFFEAKETRKQMKKVFIMATTHIETPTPRAVFMPPLLAPDHNEPAHLAYVPNTMK